MKLWYWLAKYEVEILLEVHSRVNGNGTSVQYFRNISTIFELPAISCQYRPFWRRVRKFSKENKMISKCQYLYSRVWNFVVEKSHSEFFSFYRSKRRFTNIVQDLFVFETLLFDGKVSRHTIQHQRWNFLLTWICSLDGMNDSHSISSTNAKTIQKIASWDYLRFLGKLSADYLQFSDDLYLKPCWRWQRQFGQFQGYPEHFAKHVRRVMCLHHRSYADCTHVKHKHKNKNTQILTHIPPILHKSRSRCGFVIESN